MYDLSFEDQKELLKLFLKEEESLYFCYVESNLRGASPEERVLVTKNLYGKGKEWVIPLQPGERIPELMWYRTVTDEEILQAIEINYLFACIQLRDGNKITDWSYSFAVYEDIDSLVFLIEEKVTNDFYSRVVPKIKKKFGDKWKIS